MTALPFQLLAAAGLLAGVAWLLAARFAGPLAWSLAVLAGVGYLGLLTWEVVALNRAGLGLPPTAAAPATGDPGAVGLTYAWLIAVVQSLTPRRTRAAATEGIPLASGLVLLAWPHTGLFAAWTQGAVYLANPSATLLLGVSVACSTVMVRGAASRLAMTVRDGLHRERVLLVASSIGAALALLALARQTMTARGPGATVTIWLATLAALHLLAGVSALLRAATSRVPLLPALIAGAALFGYVLLASAGRLPPA